MIREMMLMMFLVSCSSQPPYQPPVGIPASIEAGIMPWFYHTLPRRSPELLPTAPPRPERPTRQEAQDPSSLPLPEALALAQEKLRERQKSLKEHSPIGLDRELFNPAPNDDQLAVPRQSRSYQER